MFIRGISFNYDFYDEVIKNMNKLDDDLSRNSNYDVFINDNEFPFNLDVYKFFKSGESLNFEKSVNFFVGENGAGKTSFIEAFCFRLGLNKFGGGKNFKLNYSEKPILSDFISIVKGHSNPNDLFFFRAENFFNLQDDLDDYKTTQYYTGGKNSFREMSHGQGFKAFFENRLGSNGVYVFDEPESALSVGSQIEFLFLLKELVMLNNQIFIVTHSPIILSFPNSDIFDISDNFNKVDFKESSQFKDMENFIEYVDRYRSDLEKED